MTIIPPDAEILPPSDDHVFKTLLTHPDAEPVLKSVISAAIERKVETVFVRNNELQITDVDEKFQRLDVNCTVDGGNQVDVEMQCSRAKGDTADSNLNLINKSIYYLTDLHSSQKSASIEYRNLVRTYQVTFCAYLVFNQWPEYVNRFALRRPTGEQLSDQINMVIVEMNKIDALMKMSVENIPMLEAWSIFFNSADDPAKRELINNLIQTKEDIKMATELLMEISQDERQRAIMMSRRKFETDRMSDLKAENRLGREAGRAEIIELLKSGVPLDEIERRFGL